MQTCKDQGGSHYNPEFWLLWGKGDGATGPTVLSPTPPKPTRPHPAPTSWSKAHLAQICRPSPTVAGDPPRPDPAGETETQLGALRQPQLVQVSKCFPRA